MRQANFFKKKLGQKWHSCSSLKNGRIVPERGMVSHGVPAAFATSASATLRFCYSACVLEWWPMGEEGVRTHKYLQSSCVWLVKLTSAVTAPGLRNGLVATPSWRSPRMPHWLMAVLTSDVQIYIILFSFPSFSSSLSPRKRWWGFISRDEVEQLLISQHVSKCPVLTGIVCGVLIFVAYICGSGK